MKYPTYPKRVYDVIIEMSGTLTRVHCAQSGDLLAENPPRLVRRDDQHALITLMKEAALAIFLDEWKLFQADGILWDYWVWILD